MLELLRAIRGEIAEVRQDVRDVKERLTAMELSLVSLRREVVGIEEAVAHGNARFDRLANRLERIERRLDLNDAPAS